MKCFMSLLLLVAVTGLASGQRDKVVDTREHSTRGHNKKVVCYWGTWANYRPNDGKFTPESIDPSLCTHLIYSFVGLDSDTSAIKSLDPWMDLEDNYGLAGFKKATDLKYAYPNLKVTVAIGGWNEGSTKYSLMAKDPAQRQKFVDSVVQFLQKHNFDGLDLDWEYPGKRGGEPEDKENFIALIRDLRTALDKHNYLLTAAIGAAAPTIDVAYDIPKLYKYLDYVHVMCYDYHGKWDRKTGHNAPLYSRPDEKGQDLFLNVEYTLNYLLKRGAKPEKTVLGVPLYGRAFSLENPHDHGMGARSSETSFQGPYTREDGFMGYNEICEELKDPNHGWNITWDKHHQAPYMHKGVKWVSYDNEESIRAKSQFAYDQGLAGVMTWSIDTDDFLGTCSGARFPLLRAINNALYKRTQGISDGGSGSSTNVPALVLIVASLLGYMFQL